MEPTANGTTGGGTKARSLVLLGVVFLLGMICGGALFALGGHFAMRKGFMHPPMPGGRHHMVRFFDALDLDTVQQKQVQEILTRSRDEMMRQFVDTRKEIRSVLREDQWEEFDRMHPPHLEMHEMPHREGPHPH